MSEEQAATTEQKPAEEAASPEKGATYTQADVDRITEKVRKSLEAKMSKLAEEAESLKRANETEQEKAIREAEERGKKAVQTEYEAKLRALSVQTELVAAGASAETAADLAKLAPDGDVKEAVKALKERFGPLFTARSKSHGGNDGQNGNAVTPDYGPKAVEEARERMTAHEFEAWYRTNADKIRAANGIRVPGQSRYADALSQRRAKQGA